jgi:NhaP-type Na+/H+ or K+/H+ antiporter
LILCCFSSSTEIGDAESEITGTIASAYLCFWIAQSVLDVSGVLAVTTLGLYMSRHIDCITPRYQPSLRTVWQMVTYLFNTLIFIISGILVSEKMFSSR